MNKIPAVFALLFGIFSLATTKAQNQEVTISVDTLSQDVYMLTGEGGNIGIYTGQEYVFMIDDQFERLSEQLKSTISQLTDTPIAFLFNTHMHGDHSGGNARFNSESVTLVAQDNVRDRIQKNLTPKLEANELSSEVYEKMLPEVTFSKDITFHDGEETIMAFHVHNAHTDGDAMVYFVKNNVLHMGDTYFSDRYPYIDIKSGGSIEGFISAHEKALMISNDETKIIPGHGPLSNRAALQDYALMLIDITTKIQEQITAGATLEDVQKNSSLTKAYDEKYGMGPMKPERAREIIYTSLKN